MDQRHDGHTGGTVDDHEIGPLSRILRSFAAVGYEGEFCVADDGVLCCRICGAGPAPNAAVGDDQRAVVGGSTGEPAVVLALCCPVCWQRDTATMGTAPRNRPGDAAWLEALDCRSETIEVGIRR